MAGIWALQFLCEGVAGGVEQGWLTKQLLDIVATGGEWVLWLLVFLSVASVALMFERYIFYFRRRSDPQALRGVLITAVDSGNTELALQNLKSCKKGRDAMEINVLAYGLSQVDKGPRAVEELMAGALTREKARYERWLGFLGTLGNNCPFLGLFGTVLGIINAFRVLGETGMEQSSSSSGGSAVMGPIAEALIATAVGLLVAIPAVVAFNVFKGKVRWVVSNTELLSRTLLAHMFSDVAEDEGK